jgi:hypothetical protein
MGCKFSIQVDQPRNKTPRTLQRKRASSVQTTKYGEEQEPDGEEQEPDGEEQAQPDGEEQEPDGEEQEPDGEEQAPDEPDKDNEQPADSLSSSPDQVEVKTLSKQHRRDWKP